MEDLKATDSIVKAHVAPIVLSEMEKASVKEFCIASKDLEREGKNLRDARKSLSATTKSKKKWLQDWVREQGARTFVLPRKLYQDADIEMGKDGLQPVPPYLRLTRTSADATITIAVAESSVIDTDPEYVRELAVTKPPLEALALAIVDMARKSIRSTRETVSVTAKLEKGVRPIEVPEMPEPVARTMIDMHKASQKAKTLATAHKNKTVQSQDCVKRLQPVVSSFLEKAGKVSQLVKLEGGGKAKLIKKTTTRSTKITLKTFQECVESTLESLDLKSDNVESLLSSFATQQKQCIRVLLLRINALPKVSKSVVKFKSEGASESDEEDEDE